MPGELNEKQMALLAKLRSGQLRSAAKTEDPIPPLGGDAPLPLSRAQRRILFEERLHPGNIFNGTLTLDYDGELQTAALRLALDQIVDRHAILRSNVIFDGGHFAGRYNPTSPMPLEVIDLSRTAPEQVEAEVVAIGQSRARRPFDLFKAPTLIRATLVRLPSAKSILLLTMHMFAFDAPSGALFVEELASLYEDFSNSRPPGLPPLPYQYADYTAWNEADAAKGAVAALEYWRTSLVGVGEALQLPCDNARPQQPTFEASRYPFHIPADLVARLKALARSQGTSFYVVLLAALQTLLARHTHQKRFAVGAWSVQRNVRSAKLIGPFVNTVVFPTAHEAGARFIDMVAKAKMAAHGAYAHGKIPFEDIVAATDVARDAHVHPLFQVHFILQDVGVSANTGGFKLSPLDAQIGASGGYDIELVVRDLERGVEGHFECNAALFDLLEGEALRERYLRVLDLVTLAPEGAIDALELGAPEAQAPRVQAPGIGLSGEALLGPFAGERAALWTLDGEVLSFTQLEQEVRRVETWLAQRQRPCGEVAIFARPAWALVCILAAIRRGAPFVLLSEARIEAFMAALDVSPARSLIADATAPANLRELVPDHLALGRLGAATGEAQAVPAIPANQEAVGYYAWSSGTGGQAKLRAVSRGVLFGHLDAIGPALKMDAGTVSLQLTLPDFDVFIEEALPALAAGGCVVEGRLAGDNALTQLDRLVKKMGVTHVNLPASLWAAWASLLLSADAPLPGSLGTVVIGSEPADIALVRHWQASYGGQARLLNAYGVSECGVTSTLFEIPSDPAVLGRLPRLPIGRPLAHARVSIRDVAGRLAPVGVVGRIWLGGADDIETDTGDIGRLRRDGEIEWLGRADRLVKRVGDWADLEVLEIQARSHPAVSACHADIIHGARPQIRLRIEVLPGCETWLRDEWTTDFAGLRAHLAAGVLCPAPDIITADTPPDAQRREAPEEMQAVTELWTRVLGRQPSADADLFKFGATSMDFMLVAALAEQQGLPLPLSRLYALQTVAAQTAFLGRARHRDAHPAETA